MGGDGGEDDVGGVGFAMVVAWLRGGADRGDDVGEECVDRGDGMEE
nr:hypothetical protein [Tanacetum cinerariifolium]